MFITPSKVFGHLDRLSAWQRGETPAPVTVEWDLSNRCVLGCQSCHFAHTHSRGPWSMRDRRLPMAFSDVGDYAHPALVVRGLSQMAAAGVQGVVWSGGGEPTTHPQWLTLVGAAADAGLQQGMYTLGGLFRPDTAKALAARAAWVVVSLDCADAITFHHEKAVPLERFKAACDGVRWLSAPGTTTVGVSFLLHAGNWHRAADMLALSRSLGSSYTTFRPTIDEATDVSIASSDRAWIAEAMPTLEALAREADVECATERFAAYLAWSGRSYTACHGIKFNATITPDGRVWVCPQRRGIEGSCLGSLKEESFADIWARHPRQWTALDSCRVMCRLHLTNEVLATVYQPRAHEAFV
jgi:MoaA/NifB/PqqE/SkfB family radical SAM enzyme